MSGSGGWDQGLGHLRAVFDARSAGDASMAARRAASAAGPALPDWAGAGYERWSLRRAQRRAGRGRRWARRWSAGSATLWAAVAALSTVPAVLDRWEWLLLGAVSAARAALAGRELAELGRDEDALPMPTAAAPGPWELRGSAAAEPLRRGEAALVALAAMTRSIAESPARVLLRGGVAGGAELVDGLRAGAVRVVACESAARAVAHPDRRAELLRTRDGLVATMTTSVATFDDLLVAAAEAVGSVSTAAPGLERLRADTEVLREYAAALRALTG
ncbi:conserved hypothetical protein [Frankia canadensis]|uniref:Uncharacterized protein n=1 Tax=Frankia canadensis TaxID=1836972 RepID=A0A2I2KTS7_9ACTN|nr:hypothetical protein [Frankia canadensis]SNQ49073.1 conserved hypothetical protein [Frankia canadensis]SOU56363.1 conserved hypothetical protein [Frankia canadensis]